ncbi:hypothetical protein CVT26_006343 [Gymnopilus dilepis]|uniref:Uncharacterized protein n=1 Tax=Gymnopilus dilepis TaxID=231916 RepID=A0A409WBP0_9AGAR|nr:hypothetical protein CVT26_006343 [Gymnopilus dilepis]
MAKEVSSPKIRLPTIPEELDAAKRDTAGIDERSRLQAHSSQHPIVGEETTNVKPRLSREPHKLAGTKVVTVAVENGVTSIPSWFVVTQSLLDFIQTHGYPTPDKDKAKEEPVTLDTESEDDSLYTKEVSKAEGKDRTGQSEGSSSSKEPDALAKLLRDSHLHACMSHFVKLLDPLGAVTSKTERIDRSLADAYPKRVDDLIETFISMSSQAWQLQAYLGFRYYAMTRGGYPFKDVAESKKVIDAIDRVKKIEGEPVPVAAHGYQSSARLSGSRRVGTEAHDGPEGYTLLEMRDEADESRSSTEGML